MQITLLLLLGQQLAQADEPRGTALPSTYLVDSSCTKQAKECLILFEKEALLKGETCEKPPEKTKWKVPESLLMDFQKAAAALMTRVNAGDASGTCAYVYTVVYTSTPPAPSPW